MSDLPVRMPNGVMDWLENGHTVTSEAEVIAADAAALRGDPSPYEAALEWQRIRPRAVRTTGRPFMTILAEALGAGDSPPPGGPLMDEYRQDERTCADCGHRPGCPCPHFCTPEGN